MSFISYAQNLEDVMLWRALKHITNGFYVDVGAWSPDIDSVTRAFYETGWHGINIEPNPDFHQKLQERRPKDINLKVAISDTPGSLEISFIENPGLSTLDPEIARTHQAAGWGVMTQLVDVKNLRQIWEEYIPDGQEVHFLKIDVEGLEEAVIRGNDWTHKRPWIVVLEATLPMSQVESHHTWEPMLIKAGYRFVYADGLNRFYVAEEHGELEEAFKYPPNVFDEYSLASQADAERRAAEAEARANEANTRASLAEAQATEANTRASLAEAQTTEANERAHALWQQLEAVLNSRSWMLTKPLRLAGKFARWFIPRAKTWLIFAPGSRPRRISRKALVWTMNKVRANPRLKARSLTWLNKFPRLKQHLINIAFSQSGMNIHGHGPTMPVKTMRDTNTTNLTPRAQQIYMALKDAIEKKNQEGA